MNFGNNLTDSQKETERDLQTYEKYGIITSDKKGSGRLSRMTFLDAFRKGAKWYYAVEIK